MSEYNTHGAYFAPPLLQVNAGGTHEQNPGGGVQLGVDGSGVPNLVEQDETVYEDYVFSDRLKPSGTDLRNFVLPEKFAGKTFAEISKQLGKEIEQRPNDVLSNASLGVMLDRLTACQEDFKARREEAKLKNELKKLSPEELIGLGAQLGQMQQQMAQPSPDEQAITGQQGMVQPGMEQVMPVTAYGGLLRRFDNGGEIPPVAYGGILDGATVTANSPETQAFIDKINTGRNQFVKDAVSVANHSTLGLVPAISAVDNLLNGNNGEAAADIMLSAVPADKQNRFELQGASV